MKEHSDPHVGGQFSGPKRFDKKKYRLQKYSNKYKIEQWEERRKKAIIRNYYKTVGTAAQQGTQGEQTNTKGTAENENQNPSSTSKRTVSAFSKAKETFLKKNDEKQRKKEEALSKRRERKEALEKYKEKKMQRFRKLSQKTKKGQPVMKGRMEMLLDKIQRSLS